MLTEWKKFKGWRVVEFFLEHPNTTTYTSEITQKLNISKSTASTYLAAYARERLFNARKTGNVLSYALNNDLPAVKALKKFYFLQKLGETGFVQKFAASNNPVSLALYGSCASGEYSERSDADILAITQNKTLDPTLIKWLENKIKKEAGVQAYTQGEWRKMVREGSSFALSVRKNHVLLYGAEL